MFSHVRVRGVWGAQISFKNVFSAELDIFFSTRKKGIVGRPRDGWEHLKCPQCIPGTINCPHYVPKSFPHIKNIPKVLANFGDGWETSPHCLTSLRRPNVGTQPKNPRDASPCALGPSIRATYSTMLLVYWNVNLNKILKCSSLGETKTVPTKSL